MNSYRKKALAAIGSRLSQIRKLLKFNRKAMAARLSIGVGGYNKNEYGVTFPNLHTLKVLQKDLDISLDWLIFGKGPMYFKAKEEKTKDTGTEPENLSAAMPDIKNMIEDMSKDPQLRYEVLGFYFRYRKENAASSE
jgi:transcriptional regulator with XRE-family HTH domain